MQSGRKSRNFNPFATIIWVAYQGAPPNGMTGIIKMQEWWSGTKCAKVTFSKVSLENVRCCVHFFIFFVSNYNKHNVAQKWSCLIFYFFFQLFSFFLVQFFVAIQDLSFSCLFDMKISQFQHRKEKSNVFCLLKKKKNASPYTYFFVTYAFFLDNLRTSLSLHQSFLWQLNIWGQV